MKRFALLLFAAVCVSWAVMGSAQAHTCTYKMTTGKIHHFLAVVNLDSVMAKMTIVGKGDVKVHLEGGITLGDGKVSALVPRIQNIRKKGVYLGFIVQGKASRFVDVKNKRAQGSNAILLLPLTSTKKVHKGFLVFTWKKPYTRNGKKHLRTIAYRSKINCQ